MPLARLGIFHRDGLGIAALVRPEIIVAQRRSTAVLHIQVRISRTARRLDNQFGLTRRDVDHIVCLSRSRTRLPRDGHFVLKHRRGAVGDIDRQCGEIVGRSTHGQIVDLDSDVEYRVSLEVDFTASLEEQLVAADAELEHHCIDAAE